MAVFTDYARYYNLLYQDKDYAGEADFVLDILGRHGSPPERLLDLGCGTGRHALEIARRGIDVTGVDMSEVMLQMAKEAFAGCDQRTFPVALPELHHDDARTVRLDGRFDAVTSLFHVMSYQNAEADALAVMETVKVHLKPGGLFFFDFWYGPGVLSELPTARIKRMEDEEVSLERYATPDIRLEENMVIVRYRIGLTDKKTSKTAWLEEDHPMRYWFFPELRHLACLSGFSVRDQGPWMAEGKVDFSWNAWMLLELR